MTRYFSFYILGTELLFFFVNSFAGSDPSSIEKQGCRYLYRKNGSDSSECLRAVSQLTEKKLNTVYFRL